MYKDIRVLIVEDDPYARDLMSLLLTRDWRTRVVGEVDSKSALEEFLSQPGQNIDLVILDTEIPGEPELPFELADITRNLSSSPVILYTATRADAEVLFRLSQIGFGGYLLKGELLYAMASAVAEAYAGNCVITPGVQQIASRQMLPDRTLVLDGRKLVTDFTPRENELIRLGIIFNLAIRDMADELVLSPGWVSEITSTIYRKLGVREILSGDEPLESFFDDEAVLARCKAISKRTKAKQAKGQLRKAPWMATLAFHLLTVPKEELL
jgi:DNA-binding NarL/FixJ family response regulator